MAASDQELPDDDGWDPAFEAEFDDHDLDHDHDDRDLDDHDPEPRQVDPGDDDDELPGPRAAYAVNWKTVLAVDAAMGGVVALGGLVAMVVWNFALGVFLAGLGLFYVAMVVRRGRGWQHLRRQAGL